MMTSTKKAGFRVSFFSLSLQDDCLDSQEPKIFLRKLLPVAHELLFTLVTSFWEHRMLANDISATDRGYDYFTKARPVLVIAGI